MVGYRGRRIKVASADSAERAKVLSLKAGSGVGQTVAMQSSPVRTCAFIIKLPSRFMQLHFLQILIKQEVTCDVDSES